MRLPYSFHDPAGFLFVRNNVLYRQINRNYQTQYCQLMQTGLYNRLSDKHLLISHREVDIPPEEIDNAYKIIKPLNIPFISYPYEWSFSQLKHAALLTLEIQKISLEYDMILKDAHPYNIQFFKGKHIFIDTLSFEHYEPGKPWKGYQRFCRHFLAPLALMQYTDIRLGQMLLTHNKGIPLDLAYQLLPKKTLMNLGILENIWMNTKGAKKFPYTYLLGENPRVGKNALLGLLDQLTSTIQKMHWEPNGKGRTQYYQDPNYSTDAFNHKKDIVAQLIELANPKSLWDIAAKNGVFSRLAVDKKIPTIAFSVDPASVELMYREMVQNKEEYLLPLLLDIKNPTPGIGWKNEERSSLISRANADTVLALDIIQHLAISNRIPLESIADFFSKICCSLIIEFVPKSDPQVHRMILNRKSTYPMYDEEHFIGEFLKCFTLVKIEPIISSKRALYLFKKSH